MDNIKQAQSVNDFKSHLNYFLDKNKEQERLSLYQDYAKQYNVSTEEAKDLILKEIFSTYIQSSIKRALKMSTYEDGHQDAVALISQLEELKPIFKDYDVNTFTTFVSSIEKSLSVSNAEIMFENNYVSDELVSSLTDNLIKSIANPIAQPNSKEEFVSSFNSHPLLYCLQSKTETDKILSYIEDGIIEVGQYKQLITLVLEMKSEKNDEAVDFFISYLIKEDLTKGFYNIHKDESYNPESIKTLLNKITKGQPLQKYDVSAAVDVVNEHRVTIKTDAKGEIIYDNVSALTLNDSGFWIDLDNQKHFVHLHTAQGKGENQRGQQATTINLFQAKEISSASFTMVKKNAGKSDHWKDFCYEYGLHLNEQEQVLLTNLQFESDALKFLRGNMASSNLDKTNFLSTNLRLIKDSIEESKKYNELHFGLSDAEIIKNKAQLYVKFIEKHFDALQKITVNTSSEMSVSSQVVATPLLSCVEKLLQLERKPQVGTLFTQEQADLLARFINTNTANLSNAVADIKENISELLENKKDRNIDVQVYSKFTQILAGDNTNTFTKTEKEKPVAVFTYKSTGKTADEIKELLLAQINSDVQKKHLATILKTLETKDFYFSEGAYATSDLPDYFIAYRARKENNNNNGFKSDKTYYNHLETLNLICEYARLKGTKVKTFSQDYTSGFKPK